jgi:hypothetical protein
MTSRKHSGTSFIQDGENSLGDGNTIAAWEGTGMAVWFMRWLQCADTIQAADGIAIALRCQEFTRFRAGITTGAGARTPPNDRRNNVLPTRERAQALNHGGAID